MRFSTLESQNHTPANYMSEAEARDMVKGFNEHLDYYTDKVLEERKLAQTLKSNYDHELARSERLNESLKDFKSENKQHRLNIEQVNEKLMSLENQLGLKDYPSVDSEEIKRKLVSGNTLQVKACIEEVISYYSETNSLNLALVAQKEILENKIQLEKSKPYKEQQCKNCHKNFIPAENSEHSCVYHTGKLKYYSCRGCGADAYYNCCMKCKECSKGCKQNRHVV